MAGIADYAKRALRDTALREQAAGWKASRRSYSQFAEDLVIQSYYDRLRFEKGVDRIGGVVLDIGAFRPIALSNSYYFYRRGFAGINVDAAPGSKRLFDRARPRDINLEAAIGPVDGTGTFHVFGTPSVWNTLDAEAAARATRATGIVPTAYPVPIRRVDSILDAHLGGRPLEMLLVDAEGLDDQVILSNDFARYRPRVLVFEVGALTLDALFAHPMVEHLRVHDYALYSWVAPNLFFVRADSLL